MSLQNALGPEKGLSQLEYLPQLSSWYWAVVIVHGGCAVKGFLAEGRNGKTRYEVQP